MIKVGSSAKLKLFMEFPKWIFRTEKPTTPEEGAEEGLATKEGYKSPDESLLESADIEKTSPLGGGVTDTSFVKLEGDGGGIFKRIEGREKDMSLGKSYQKERAAYLADLFLGFNLVPATIIRNIEGKEGSLQKFIPESRTGSEMPIKETMALEKSPEYKTMCIFDYIIGNTDRHFRNYLVDKNKKLWAIDHHLTFRTGAHDPYDYSFSKYVTKQVKYKIRALAESEDKKTLLRKLLLELLEEERVNNFFQRLALCNNKLY